jgi:hypothetical protein
MNAAAPVAACRPEHQPVQIEKARGPIEEGNRSAPGRVTAPAIGRRPFWSSVSDCRTWFRVRPVWRSWRRW